MEKTNVQPEEQEIDLLEVFCVLWHRAWLLFLSFVVGVALAGAVTFLMGAVKNTSDTLDSPDTTDIPYTPLYQATSIIYAFTVNDDAESYLLELELSSSLAADLRILGTTREVVESALKVCGVEMSYEDVVGAISVGSPTAHMLQITVTDEDPQLAAQLSNALGDQLKRKVAEVMGIDVPSTVEHAAVPTDPINPVEPDEPDEPVNPIPANLKRNCILGGLVFFVLAAGAVLMNHFLRDSFKEKMAVIRGQQRDRK